MKHTTFFEKLAGRWAGHCQTWFEPGQLSDESDVSGDFVLVFDGRFVRHTYTGSMQGRPRHGEELISFNEVTQRYQMTWIDDFHMNYAIQFSEGRGSEKGFSVTGAYDVGENSPPWGWQTDYKLIDDNQLLITAYNISPEGEKAKAVETTYRRQK